MLEFAKKRQKIVLPYMETHLVDHCNLKCNNCGHYCHLIDEEIFTDINLFKKDFSELSQKVNFYCIRLMGGEPLLNPDINEFIIAARKYFPSSDIRIVTNGILLPKMKADFWQTLKENMIRIDLSKYPIYGNKFSEYLDLIDDNRVMLGHIELKKRFYSKLNTKGNADKCKSFKACASKNAVNLWNGKLYNCQACYRYYYNKKFNQNIPMPPGINIYEANAKEIKEFFFKPTEACRYCSEISIEENWSQYKADHTESIT